MDAPRVSAPSASGPDRSDAPARQPGAGRWWGVAPDPELPKIGARRAYAEVLLVYAAFFLAAIVAAGLLLADRYHDPTQNASWALYLTNAVDILGQIGLAVAVVILLSARRGVTLGALGFRLPRQPDGRLAVSQTVRIAAWSFLAIIVGSVINALLQTGSLPEHHASAPELIFGFVDSVQAGVIEELVVLAFVVVTLRQARRPWPEVAVVALVLRAAYHIYYGPGVVGILVWAALFLWIYLRFRQVVPLMVCHALWDIVAFFSQATAVVAVVGMLVVAALWLAAVILWLAGRNRVPVPAGAPEAHYAGTLPNGTFPPGPGPGPRPGPLPLRGPLPPPGWHPDPAGHNRWRWWDGSRWTEHVSPHS